MLHFKYSSVINSSVENVWQFYERPDILQLLIPIRVLKRNSQMRKVSHRFKLFRNRIEKVETFA